MRDLDRIRYVSRHYEALQGLRHVPWAAWLVFVGGGTAFWFAPPSGFLDVGWGRDLALVVGTAVCLVLSFLAAGYYDARFGRVVGRGRRGDSGRDLALSVVVVVLSVLVSAFGERLGETALSAYAGCLLAGFILYAWWERRHRLTAHWPIVAVLCAIAGLLPAVTPLPGHGISLLSILLGSLLSAGLLLDHLLLARTLGTVPEEGGDG